MELAMQVISNDKTVRNDTIQDLKELPHNLYRVKPKKGNS